MNYAAIKTHDIANGPGVRVSLFVSGCTHRCPGCFNKETWDFDYGTPFDQKAENKIITSLSPDYIKGFSLLGGEPFEGANRPPLADLLVKIKTLCPNKSVWCYTGYDFEDILAFGIADPAANVMISNIDVLVDGKFIEKQKDLNLRFRGSSNQRIIDVNASLNAGFAVLWNPEK